MVDFIEFGSKRIDFHLEFSERKTLGITVTSNMKVLVKAPLSADLEKIKSRIRKRAAWIIKQQNFFLNFHPKMPVRKFISGETHMYLGRQYQLKVIKGNMNLVKYKGQHIEIITTNPSKAKELLNHWYRTKAKDKFAEIAEPLILHFKKFNVEPKGLYIQEMSKRWGSCTSKGKIILNPELIKAPKTCIKYVIVHELCHLVYHNHTKAFFELQQQIMPDWKKWKEKLEICMAI